MESRRPLQIGLLGWGTVGLAVARALLHDPEHLARQAGRPLLLRRGLVRDPGKARAVETPPGVLVTDASVILDDPEIDLIVELMGGEEPARSYLQRALEAGKHVVTANKEVLAKHGSDLGRLAREQGRALLFEAAVGGGIPIVSPLLRDLAANRVYRLQAIINGTTNYILTQLAEGKQDFDEALRQAQELGYAEADPTADVEAYDPVYKLAILASLAFGSPVRPGDIHREGITGLERADFQQARRLGYSLKLVALAAEQDGDAELRVHPAFVPQDHPLAHVDGVVNAVVAEGDLVGRLVFQGRGAGAAPTASAVLSDVLRVARGEPGTLTAPRPRRAPLRLRPMAEIRGRYYLRLHLAEQPDAVPQVMASIAGRGVPIERFERVGGTESAAWSEYILLTGPATERDLQRAAIDAGGRPLVRGIPALIRVLDTN